MEEGRLIGKKIDIFGDGECIVDEDNFPDEIVVKSGKWKKINQVGRIPGYSFLEPSQWYIDNVAIPARKETAELQKKIDRQEKINRKMREMAKEALQKWKCSVCDYIYDPELGDSEHGVDPKTPWKELPQDWLCPSCGADKEKFKKYEEEE